MILMVFLEFYPKLIISPFQGLVHFFYLFIGFHPMLLMSPLRGLNEFYFLMFIGSESFAARLEWF